MQILFLILIATPQISLQLKCRGSVLVIVSTVSTLNFEIETLTFYLQPQFIFGSPSQTDAVFIFSEIIDPILVNKNAQELL